MQLGRGSLVASVPPESHARKSPSGAKATLNKMWRAGASRRALERASTAASSSQMQHALGFQLFREIGYI